MIRDAYQQPMFDGPRIRGLEKELIRAVRREEVYWRTKSRIQWLRDGDKNTRFFHAQTLKRRRRNVIRGLEEDDGTWCTKETRIHDIAVDYFISLFSTDRPNTFLEILQCVPNRVGDMDNNLLTTAVTDVEIEIALFQMHPMKSPRPDGFNARFFHHHWQKAGGVVIGMVKSFFCSKKKC